MSYKLEWIRSPNFTPKSQVPAVYGRARTIQFGAGHWWGDPKAGYSHQGVINTFKNPARQASAHAVVSAGRVTEMVKKDDVAWATNNANPYTFAIELKPNATVADKETCAEYIADKGLHNTSWYPHKKWWPTACNPLDWGAIMRRAQAIYKAKHAPKPKPTPTPAPTPAKPKITWTKLAKPLVMEAEKSPTKLWDFNKTAWNQFTKSVKDFKKGERITIYGKAVNETLKATYLLTEYSFNARITHGFNQADLEPYVAPPPAKPEWQANLKDIKPVKLQVLVPESYIIDLNTLKTIKPLGQGTWVDFVKKTTVKGTEYLISSYSATNAMPNGIPLKHVGLPAPAPEPPIEDKPEWLKNWRDITDVTMYARVDAPVVNLINGETVATVKRGTPVEIASATDWHGKEYLITKWATSESVPHGIILVDLDMKPIEQDQPIPPSQPTEDLIKENNRLLNLILGLLQKIWDAITK